MYFYVIQVAERPAMPSTSVATTPSQMTAAPTAASGSVADGFRQAMRGLAATVTLVTARGLDGHWKGMAATAVASVSMEPPTCLLCVNRTASIYSTLIDTGRFCINIMQRTNVALMPPYTKPQHREERFHEAGWGENSNGVPYQRHAQSNIFCEISTRLEVGTHDVVIARVVDVLNGSVFDPLIYCDGSYRE
jgi:flavin reductase